MADLAFPIDKLDAKSFSAVQAFNRRCLDCGLQLDQQMRDIGRDQIICRCGVCYSIPLLRNSHAYSWELVRNNRMFVRDGDQLTVLLNGELHVDESGIDTENLIKKPLYDHEKCWIDNCESPFDRNSETGLCGEHLAELKGHDNDDQ